LNDKKDNRSQSVIKAIDPFLPPDIRDNNSLSLEGLIRSRVLTIILISSIAATVFSLVLFVFFQSITPLDFSNAIIISAISMAIAGLEYLYFYKSGRLDAAAVLYSLTLFIVSVIAIALTGGHQSPIRPMLLVCPVVGFLISGRQEGVYNAALVLVTGIIFLILDGIGFKLMQVMPETILSYISGMVWFITIVMIVVCLYVYDLLLEDKRSVRARQ
jgi:hypothetical protein